LKKLIFLVVFFAVLFLLVVMTSESESDSLSKPFLFWTLLWWCFFSIGVWQLIEWQKTNKTKKESIRILIGFGCWLLYALIAAILFWCGLKTPTYYFVLIVGLPVVVAQHVIFELSPDPKVYNIYFLEDNKDNEHEHKGT
jgi:peptidoglycan/LPS O-acetylase OafA/YrhL